MTDGILRKYHNRRTNGLKFDFTARRNGRQATEPNKEALDINTSDANFNEFIHKSYSDLWGINNDKTRKTMFSKME